MKRLSNSVEYPPKGPVHGARALKRKFCASQATKSLTVDSLFGLWGLVAKGVEDAREVGDDIADLAFVQD